MAAIVLAATVAAVLPSGKRRGRGVRAVEMRKTKRVGDRERDRGGKERAKSRKV